MTDAAAWPAWLGLALGGASLAAGVAAWTPADVPPALSASLAILAVGLTLPAGPALPRGLGRFCAVVGLVLGAAELAVRAGIVWVATQ